GNAFVPLQHWIGSTDQPITVTDRRRYMGEFVTPRLPLTNSPAQSLERLDKERLNVVGLKSSRFGAFHIFTNARNTARVHRVVSERPFFKQFLKMRAVDGAFYSLSQTRPYVRPLSIADSLDQEIPERPSFKLQLTENIKYLPAER